MIRSRPFFKLVILGLLWAGLPACKHNLPSGLAGNENPIASVDQAKLELKGLSDAELAKRITEQRRFLLAELGKLNIKESNVSDASSAEMVDGPKSPKTIYSGAIVNGKVIDAVIQFINEKKVEGGFVTASQAERVIKALTDFKSSASAQVKNVDAVYRPIKVRFSFLKLSFREGERRLTNQSVSNASTALELTQLLAWSRRTSFDIRFRTDTDKIKTSCAISTFFTKSYELSILTFDQKSTSAEQCVYRVKDETFMESSEDNLLNINPSAGERISGPFE